MVKSRGNSSVITLVLLVILGLVIWQRQALADWFKLHDYQPSATISQLAHEDTMTPAAQHIFYINHPQLLSSSDKFNQLCQQHEQTIVLGCYLSGESGIYLRTVTDSRLNGVEEVTAAHEMLHGAYERLSSKERQTVDAELLDYYNHDVQDQRLIDVINAYKKTEPDAGVDFNNPDHGQINYAQTNISPGSSFKPYDYTTLINNNTDVGAGSVLYDSQGPIPGYSCTNKAKPSFNGTNAGGNCLWDYDFRYPGPVTLRYALGGSRNVPAVKAMEEAVPNDTSGGRSNSVNKVISTANQMMSAPDAYRCFNEGVDTNTAKKSDETQCYGSSAIGDGAYLHLDQHVNGLATLARMGNAIPSTYILKIYDSASSSKPFYQWTQPKGTQVVRQDAAYIVDNMASDPNASYLPAGYYKWHNYNGWHNAVKTGTTNNGFDGLMMGWNTQYAVGSWVGYHTRNKSLSGAMEYSTTPLTRGFMTQALDALHTKPVNWTEPSDMQHLPAYVVRSHVGIGSVEPSPSTDLFPSWYKPRAVSAQAVTIDKVSGKLATNCTPAAAKETLGGNAAPNTFSIDQFYPPGQTNGSVSASNTSASDDVHNCGDSPPTVTITAADCNGSCTISATPFAGTHPLNDSNYPSYPGTVTIAVNGNTICTSSNISDGQPVQCPYTATFDGQGTVTATVTDSVLYQGSDSATINFTQANQPPPQATGPSNFQANTVGTGINKKTIFSWSDNGNAPYTVFKQGGGAICTTSTTFCQVSFASAPSGTVAYVQDKSQNKSNTATVP